MIEIGIIVPTRFIFACFYSLLFSNYLVIDKDFS